MPLGRLAVRYAIEGTALRETHRVILLGPQESASDWSKTGYIR